MKRTRRGATLIELLVAMAIGTIVLSLGYRIHVLATRNDEIASARESATINTENLMNRIKADVRAASSVDAGSGFLVIHGRDGRIRYQTTAAGVERADGGRSRVFREVSASFSRRPGSGGVSVRVESNTVVHRRPVRVEINSFVSPRNR